MSYAGYEYYLTNYRGSIIPGNEFDTYVTRASEFLDYYTFGKAKVTQFTTELANAACAVAEVLYKAVKTEEEHAGIKSESVGSWSATYVTPEEQRKNTRLAAVEAARRYLIYTGLLYRGA